MQTHIRYYWLWFVWSKPFITLPTNVSNGESILITAFRPRHKIHNPKCEPNPSRKTRSVSGPKCKKYPNGSHKVVQNISDPEVLLTEPERITRKPEKPKNRKRYTKKPIQMSKLIYNVIIWNMNIYFKYSISYLFLYVI